MPSKKHGIIDRFHFRQERCIVFYEMPIKYGGNLESDCFIYKADNRGWDCTSIRSSAAGSIQFSHPTHPPTRSSLLLFSCHPVSDPSLARRSSVASNPTSYIHLSCRSAPTHLTSPGSARAIHQSNCRDGDRKNRERLLYETRAYRESRGSALPAGSTESGRGKHTRIFGQLTLR